MTTTSRRTPPRCLDETAVVMEDLLDHSLYPDRAYSSSIPPRALRPALTVALRHPGEPLPFLSISFSPTDCTPSSLPPPLHVSLFFRNLRPNTSLSEFCGSVSS
ncbi:Uncharacterized protein M6B38_245095 [Iris pallida]|uniref:Uncharacterized protein n=1 Tax=Iris pallida TaxID=29817 RepID=A0AAX6DI66_IRIPA|nr:Uncharacterized protein M6B38_245095 [Iris pallida]